MKIIFLNTLKEVNILHLNKSISCSVTECKHHGKAEAYCTLGHIDVVKHSPTASTVQCTDCGSFEKDTNC